MVKHAMRVAMACLAMTTVTAAQGPATATMDRSAAALTATAEWATHAQNEYLIAPNVTYLTASGADLKLDVYRRRDVTTPQKTMVFYHGGGWIGGTKEASFMSVMPWLEMGWNVVNVEYRMARVAEAPAAVEDALCALRFVVAQAKTYNVDPTKIVVSGESAGGHLALAVGMIPQSTGFTNICSGGGFAGFENAVPKVAAIINWYGITDVNDMLGGPNARSYAVQWLGSGRDRDDLAKRVSPMTYVRAGLPPIMSIQGDADPIVPYSQNTRLRDALSAAGVQNELVTIPGGGHGNFKPEERTKAYVRIREFLTKNGL
jgi:acetyl esterase/lipase